MAGDSWRHSARGQGGEEVADGRPEFVPGARGGLAQERLELGEQLLDRVQIGAVGWQVKERGAGRGDRLADAIDPVRGQVVKHHDIARLERRGRRELLHIGAEGDAGHWPVQHQRCDDAAVPEPSDEGRGAPDGHGHGRNQTPTRRGCGPQRRPCWWRCLSRRERTNRAGAMKCCLARHSRRLPATSGRSCSAAPQRLFMPQADPPGAPTVDGERPAWGPQRRCSSVWSSASVRSGGRPAGVHIGLDPAARICGHVACWRWRSLLGTC